MNLDGPVAGKGRPSPTGEGEHQVTIEKTWIHTTSQNAVEVPQMIGTNQDGRQFGDGWYLGDKYGYGRRDLFQFAAVVAEALGKELTSPDDLKTFTSNLFKKNLGEGVTIIATVTHVHKDGKAQVDKNNKPIYSTVYSVDGGVKKTSSLADAGL